MKKSLALVCVMVILATVLSGCIQKPDLKVFNSWLTDNGFTPGMSEKSMLFKISTYTYLGKALSADSQFVGEKDDVNQVGSSFWGLNSNSSTKNGTVHTYLNFYVRKNLDNLQFPGDVRIGDSKADCLKKLDLEGKRTNVKDITIGNKTCEMTMNDSNLVYTEVYNWLDSHDTTVSVTRTIMLKFQNDALYEVAITISEKQPE